MISVNPGEDAHLRHIAHAEVSVIAMISANPCENAHLRQLKVSAVPEMGVFGIIPAVLTAESEGYLFYVPRWP